MAKIKKDPQEEMWHLFLSQVAKELRHVNPFFHAYLKMEITALVQKTINASREGRLLSNFEMFPHLRQTFMEMQGQQIPQAPAPVQPTDVAGPSSSHGMVTITQQQFAMLQAQARRAPNW